jgi:hypothetical protein
MEEKVAINIRVKYCWKEIPQLTLDCLFIHAFYKDDRISSEPNGLEDSWPPFRWEGGHSSFQNSVKIIRQRFVLNYCKNNLIEKKKKQRFVS